MLNIHQKAKTTKERPQAKEMHKTNTCVWGTFNIHWEAEAAKKKSQADERRKTYACVYWVIIRTLHSQHSLGGQERKKAAPSEQDAQSK